MCQVLLAILALICPPLAVLLDQGCTCDLCINLLLTALVWVPGVIHAWYLILCREKSHVTNVYVHANRNNYP
uniref:Uncharacterized protein n=1 Tax=Caenorhabditis japonica TaxID=281687 RepID=A0A8R1IHH5_CAEJA